MYIWLFHIHHIRVAWKTQRLEKSMIEILQKTFAKIGKYLLVLQNA